MNPVKFEQLLEEYSHYYAYTVLYEHKKNDLVYKEAYDQHVIIANNLKALLNSAYKKEVNERQQLEDNVNRHKDHPNPFLNKMGFTANFENKACTKNETQAAWEKRAHKIFRG